MRNTLWLTALLVICLMSAQSVAGNTVCDALPKEKKTVAERLLSTLKSHGTCTQSIATCIKGKSPDPIADRLATDICRRVKKGEAESKIQKRVERRAESVRADAIQYPISVTDATLAGDKNAPVTVVVYACSRCPFCSRLVPALHKEVTQGKLKGKVKLYFKPFPLKSHEFSKEGGFALLAAAKLNQFWPFALAMYQKFDQFEVDQLGKWAAALGMNQQKFEGLLKDPEIRKALVANKKEGLANGVKGTPQLFINGKKYMGFLDMEEVVDVLEEVASK